MLTTSLARSGSRRRLRRVSGHPSLGEMKYGIDTTPISRPRSRTRRKNTYLFSGNGFPPPPPSFSYRGWAKILFWSFLTLRGEGKVPDLKTIVNSNLTWTSCLVFESNLKHGAMMETGNSPHRCYPRFLRLAGPGRTSSSRNPNPRMSISLSLSYLFSSCSPQGGERRETLPLFHAPLPDSPRGKRG